MTPRPSIHVFVERLVVEGLDLASSSGTALGRAVETELARLLGLHGLASQFLDGASVPAVRAADLTLRADERPAALGTRVARTVFGAIGAQAPAPTSGNGHASGPGVGGGVAPEGNS